MAASAAIILTAGSTVAYGQTDREKALEERVKYLEERLARVEQALGAATNPKANRPARATKHASRAGAVNESAASAPPSPEPAKVSEAANMPTTAANDANTSPSPAPSKPGVGEADEAPQELNVLRENAVTLKPTRVEISDEVDYLRHETVLQNDRAVVSTTNIRYGVLNWLELSALIPAGHSTRTTTIAPFSSVSENVSGFGDLVFQANARLFQQTKNWPGVVLSLGMIAPTGSSPYNFTGYQLASTQASAPNPRNPLAFYYSQGAWGVHSNLEFYKTVDPVILFFGFGADYVFPQQYGVYTVAGFPRWSYNFGLSFALSEKTTLGFSVSGVYTPDLKVNGRDVFQSSLEPSTARVTLIQRLMKGFWLEPSVVFGMDQDAPDFGLGLALRARF